MSNLKRISLFILLLAVAACNAKQESAPPAAKPAAATPAANVTVRGEVFTAADGSLAVAWIFGLADGWHLYADLLNDSGYPPSITWQLPEGWTAGPLRWPVPARHVMPGDILDHVYEGALVLEQALTAPGGRRPDADTTLQAKVAWLACRSECVPGQAQVTVTVPGGQAPLPRPVDLPQLAWPTALPAGAATVTQASGRIIITAPGARALRFFPSPGSGPFVDLGVDGQAEGDTLVLRLRPSPSSAPPRCAGLLQIEGKDGAVLTGPFDCLDPNNHGG